MKPEEIKIGETYYIRVKADSKDSESVYCQLIDADGNGRKALSFYNWMLYSFTPVPAAPKYDPCRRFKAGDKARVVDYKGRGGSKEMPAGTLGTVALDETEDDWVELKVKIDGKIEWYDIDPAYLELVTPVDELEPYHINEIFDIDDGKLIGYEVAHGDTRESIFYGGETHLRSIEKAKAAAEADRDRLNAEYRKERK